MWHIICPAGENFISLRNNVNSSTNGAYFNSGHNFKEKWWNKIGTLIGEEQADTKNNTWYN